MHISGTFSEKQDIDRQKQDIGEEKQDIGITPSSHQQKQYEKLLPCNGFLLMDDI